MLTLNGVQSLYLGTKLETWKKITRMKPVHYPHKTESKNLSILGSCSDFSITSMKNGNKCVLERMAVHIAKNLVSSKVSSKVSSNYCYF